MNILDSMAQDKKDYALPEGKHVAMILSADYKVLEKSGTEVVNVKLMLQDGTVYYHSFFAHTEGSIKMAAPQLKKLMLLEKLPIYKTVNDRLNYKIVNIERRGGRAPDADNADCRRLEKRFSQARKMFIIQSAVFLSMFDGS